MRRAILALHPINPMATHPLTEQRATSRPRDPRCPECKSADVRATLRTPYAVYFRCETCEHLWAIQKPALSDDSTAKRAS
jgi:hypothetical protein